jgi:catechol 2,3-dioxygenase-like lactoylglutathione lyase family enzyme
MSEPLFSGVHHIGFTVPDLDQALEFMVNHLGFELVSRHGPFASSAEGSVKDWFDVDPQGVAHYAFVRLGSSTLELLQWSGLEQNQHLARNSDWSGRHLALSVSDLDEAMERLSKVPGVRLMKPRGKAFVYVQTPWGLYLQLMAASPK